MKCNKEKEKKDKTNIRNGMKSERSLMNIELKIKIFIMGISLFFVTKFLQF